MEVVIKDQVFFQAVDLVIPTRPDSGVDMRQGPSGPGPKPDNGGKKEDANKENQGKDDPMEGKGDRMSEFDLDAPEKDLLDYDFKEMEVGRTNETPSFMSSTKEHPASLCPVESSTLIEAHQRRGMPTLLCQSP